jgi:hypothetical protein
MSWPIGWPVASVSTRLTAREPGTFGGNPPLTRYAKAGGK